ncbi:MAG TPA: hypothetical protein VK163_13050 [Opitutaceae bacterium]|nr:hypothetical protein [Opitutaceae bacterium]
MNPALCRRQFVAHGLALAGAALLLPVQRLSAAVSPRIGDGAAARVAADPAHRAALALIGCYGSVAAVEHGAETTRITVAVRDIDAMQRALATARGHGIARVAAEGNLARFQVHGRRFELENLLDVA